MKRKKWKLQKWKRDLLEEALFFFTEGQNDLSNVRCVGVKGIVAMILLRHPRFIFPSENKRLCDVMRRLSQFHNVVWSPTKACSRHERPTPIVGGYDPGCVKDMTWERVGNGQIGGFTIGTMHFPHSLPRGPSRKRVDNLGVDVR